MRKLFLLLLFYFIYSYEENSIMKLPNRKGKFENIPTKYGLINYSFINDCLEFIKWPLPFVEIYLEGINNLSLFTLTKNKTYEEDYELYGDKNNSIKMKFPGKEKDIFNPLLCEIFYKTKYIDKMIYSIGYYENNKPFKFFGGTPEMIIKNLNKFTFNDKTDFISKIDIINNNGKIITINIEEKNKRFRFDEEYGNMIGLPSNIFKIFYNLLFKDYKEQEIFRGCFIKDNAYELNEEQIKVFPNILITIGNKIINLHKKRLFSEENNKLFIYKLHHDDDFYFGQKFFELFEITEFDLYTNDINLYLDKNKYFIFEIKDKKKNIKNSNFNIIAIIFFLLLISIIITVL